MMRVSVPIVAAAATAVALVPTWLWAQAPSETDRYAYGPHHMRWWGGGWYGMIFGPLIMILVLALVIAAVVLLIRWAGWQLRGGAPHQGRSPLDILKERSPAARSTKTSLRSGAAYSATEPVRPDLSW
jgi:putative membrane protein